jgi:hypothetical protein
VEARFSHGPHGGALWEIQSKMVSKVEDGPLKLCLERDGARRCKKQSCHDSPFYTTWFFRLLLQRHEEEENNSVHRARRHAGGSGKQDHVAMGSGQGMPTKP